MGFNWPKAGNRPPPRNFKQFENITKQNLFNNLSWYFRYNLLKMI